MKRLGITGTIRASFSIYNEKKDLEKLVEALKKAKEILL
jgi:cysteine desulfurase/selenocysteine lyase